MKTSAHPLRFRLRGGRNVHAVKYIPGSEAATTACGQMVVDSDERQYEGKPVTCAACARRLAASPLKGTA
ncbi:hypothetical protein [Streptomyces yangpuensis]|uniref:hypothetical protein n=1 Tax=Streptomyces yangpuensis TaxID=1648182 RepID=UPI0035DEAC00